MWFHSYPYIHLDTCIYRNSRADIHTGEYSRPSTHRNRHVNPNSGN